MSVAVLRVFDMDVNQRPHTTAPTVGTQVEVSATR